MTEHVSTHLSVQDLVISKQKQLLHLKLLQNLEGKAKWKDLAIHSKIGLVPHNELVMVLPEIIFKCGVEWI